MAAQAKDKRKTTQIRRARNPEEDGGDTKEKPMPNYLKPTMSSCRGSSICQYPTRKQSASVRKCSVVIAKTTLPSPSPPQPQVKKEESSRDKVSSLLPKPSNSKPQPPPPIKIRSSFRDGTPKRILGQQGKQQKGKTQPSSPPNKKSLVVNNDNNEEKHEDGPMTPRAKATSFSDEEETVDELTVETMTARRNSVGELVEAFETVIVCSESQLLTTLKGEKTYNKSKDVVVKESRIGQRNDDDDEDEMGQREEIEDEGEDEEEIKTEANQCTDKEEIKVGDEEEEEIKTEANQCINKEEEDKCYDNVENKLTLLTEVEAIESVDNPKQS